MKAFMVTANRLHDGEVVYLTASNEWSETLSEARSVETKEEAQALFQSVETAVEELRVVGPYISDVALGEDELSALSQRERIRAKGPTVHKHFGKQARQTRGGGDAHV